MLVQEKADADEKSSQKNQEIKDTGLPALVASLVATVGGVKVR